MLIGVTGACRCDEMVKMKTVDIEDKENVIIIKIPDSKTRQIRSFTIIGQNYIKLYKKYASLRPENFTENRFFIKYQNGKCYRSVMGIHSISAVAQKVASYLNLNDASAYTGHSLRRTSATFLIDGGGNLECLKRHGGWKSSTVAEGYIEDSIRNKNDNAQKILNPHDSPTSGMIAESCARPSVSSTITNAYQESGTFLHGFNFENASLTNCTFNITINKNDV